MLISVIVAADQKNGIGQNNQLLCHLPADLKYFKAITTGHCLIMGRKTFESIGKPLPNRTNIILTKTQTPIDGCLIASTLEQAIEIARQKNETEVFIIGGGMVYEKALLLADKIYLTRIQHTFIDADTFFRGVDEQLFMLIKTQPQQADEHNEYGFSFEVWEKRG